jgi:hypothetical protein
MNDPRRSESIARDLGTDALAALRHGTEWEYEPESAECGDAWAYSCGGKDGCTRLWHQDTYVSGYRIEDGKLYHVLHECDEDGNWDVIEECDVDDTHYDQWWSDYAEEKRRQGWDDYAEYVARTGLDPLGNYHVVRSHEEQWTAKLRQDDDGLRFVGAHRRSLAYIARVAITNPDDLPDEVRSWLYLDAQGRVEGLSTLDDLSGDYATQREGDSAVITFSVTIPDSEEAIRQRLRQVASRGDTAEDGETQPQE